MSEECELAALLLEWHADLQALAAIFPEIESAPVHLRAQLDQLEAFGREGPPLRDFSAREWSAWTVAVALAEMVEHDPRDGAR